MSGGPFRKAAMVFSRPKTKPKAAGQMGTGKPQNCQAPAAEVNASRKPLEVKETNNAGKTMPFLPAIPFTAGPWTSKDENRLKIGKRMRKWSDDRDHQRPSRNDDCNDCDNGTKSFTPVVQMTQGRVPRLWNRKGRENISTFKAELSSPLASEDECCKFNRSNNSICEAPKEHQISLSSSGETNSSRSSFMKMRWLSHFRKRRVGSPYSTLGPSEEGMEIQLIPSDEDSEFEVHGPLTSSMPPKGDICTTSSVERNSVVTTEPQDCEESFLDLESTDCVLPSVTGLSTAADEELFAMDTPRIKQRKPRRAKHGDDSVLIGMTIIFDPTAELLNMGNEPQCIAKTSLGKLQKIDDYEGYLLGDWKEEESTEELPSFSDLLGFHLDCFAAPNVNTSMEIDQGYPFSSIHDEEEINFEFPQGGDEHDTVMDYQDTAYRDAEREEEIEIVFFPINHVYTPNDDDEASQFSSVHGNACFDCESNSSEGSALPLEWMLPKPRETLPIKLVNSESMLDPPEYEWFLPDHLDIDTRNRHAPSAVFGVGQHEKPRISVTPSTVGETLSFDVQSSFDGSEGSEILSAGSLPSEAVQSLIEFCQMSDTCSVGYRHHQACGLDLLTRTSMSIISRGIDF